MNWLYVHKYSIELILEQFGKYLSTKYLSLKNILLNSLIKLLPRSAQAQAPAGLSSIIITVVHPASSPASHPEKYNFQARAMLGSSLASSFLH